MKSIRGKFTVLSLISILLCAALVGGVCLWTASNAQRSSFDRIMVLTGRQEGGALDAELLRIRSSVDIFAEGIAGSLDSAEKLRDEESLAEFMEEAGRLMGNIAGNTPGICSYYLRIAPELTEGAAGFLFTQRRDQEGMYQEPLTDLALYEPEDTEHVGWYYQPLKAGHAVWTEPYFNLNLDKYMVSYVAPLYIGEAFLGVAGMDVDFDVVIRGVQRIRPYETGYAFLTSDTGKILYHPSLEHGAMLVESVPELREAVEDFTREAEPDAAAIYPYSFGGAKKAMTFFRLSNGMELIITAEQREVYSPLNELARIIVSIALGLALGLFAISASVSGRITRPLVQLTKAADQIAAGNMDVELPAVGRDEVGRLTRSLGITVQSLKRHLTHMNYMAYRDPLTSVKNKAAYEAAEKELQSQIDSGEADFALLMLDVNKLKTVNDRYGHARGDEYLRKNCMTACQVFKHSPIYRIGGDEFLVLLQGRDNEARETLMAELERLMEESQREKNLWDRVSVAMGLGVYQPGDRSPEEVFRRADREMYVNKRGQRKSRESQARGED